MKTYTTKNDAIEQYIEPALGDFASDFDMEEIFNQAFEYSEENNGFVLAIDEGDFFDVAQNCER